MNISETTILILTHCCIVTAKHTLNLVLCHSVQSMTTSSSAQRLQATQPQWRKIKTKASDAFVSQTEPCWKGFQSWTVYSHRSMVPSDVALSCRKTRREGERCVTDRRDAGGPLWCRCSGGGREGDKVREGERLWRAGKNELNWKRRMWRRQRRTMKEKQEKRSKQTVKDKWKEAPNAMLLFLGWIWCSEVAEGSRKWAMRCHVTHEQT